MSEILTIESRFGFLIKKRIEKTRPEQSLHVYITENPHMWMFYLYPGSNQDFVWPLGKTDAPVVEPRVYRGSWLIDCPFCASAQHASDRDHWFFCANCKNSRADSLSVPVSFHPSRPEIETVLSRRPFTVNRNWHPSEDPLDLLKENETHGV